LFIRSSFQLKRSKKKTPKVDGTLNDYKTIFNLKIGMTPFLSLFSGLFSPLDARRLSMGAMKTVLTKMLPRNRVMSNGLNTCKMPPNPGQDPGDSSRDDDGA
jgi:hypothetical protein